MQKKILFHCRNTKSIYSTRYFNFDQNQKRYIHFYKKISISRGGTHSGFLETPATTTYFQGGYFLLKSEY